MITIIEAPSNLGLKVEYGQQQPGVRLFPAALQATGLYQRLGAASVTRVEPPPYKEEIDPSTDILNAVEVADYSRQLAQAILDSTIKRNFILVVGGDCSILLGCAAALQQLGQFALFYLDGHTDYMLPRHSSTHGAAGMDLALVTGHGPERLTRLLGTAPCIREDQVYAVGNADFEDWYTRLIEESAITYYDLNASRHLGLSGIPQAFIRDLDEKACDGFWIHLDVDVLHPSIMPCVDSPNMDGFYYEELDVLLSPLLASPLCKGMDITIFDPTKDKDGHHLLTLSEKLYQWLNVLNSR